MHQVFFLWCEHVLDVSALAQLQPGKLISSQGAQHVAHRHSLKRGIHVHGYGFLELARTPETYVVRLFTSSLGIKVQV